MTNKELKNYDLIFEIYEKLFGYFNGYKIEKEIGLDVLPQADAFREKIDITQTSGNLDFKVSTYQSRGENIYFNISLYDYEKKTEHKAGYFYIKNNTGTIGLNETKALFYIMQAGNDITEKIFEEIQKGQ